MKPIWNPQLVYDRYFSSGTYTARYPVYNQRSLDVILSYTQNVNYVLDFGCGEGRYTLPILQHTSASVIACDISTHAIAHLKQKLSACPVHWSDRTTLIEGEVHQITGQVQLDVVIAMFGVLSHIAGQKNRIELLQTLRHLLHANGKGVLIISVPNARRRFFGEQMRHRLFREYYASGSMASEPGDIVYSRTFKNQETYEMYYHLYTVTSLKHELQEAGFQIKTTMAESVFAESTVTRNPLFHDLDKNLTAVAPACLGYGILAIATT
ncbi:class I SAM-dependent methyltransferase [Oscillatoria sp. FACHB-1407]|uniref:class I SAM-dependent methyltransferase n=1 Tax=Oscillatoria sp. FACHB-1407 TaxID=2692847 RepID=UPI00168961C8|nr:class I SAM-dependent methyltransferase [Oscillatoria sp. FACHB-1407]MBD2460430.1 class I SAM-dependent methyltransferase [Oscillatoria sp. FACHB-1407]